MCLKQNHMWIKIMVGKAEMSTQVILDHFQCPCGLWNRGGTCSHFPMASLPVDPRPFILEQHRLMDSEVQLLSSDGITPDSPGTKVEGVYFILESFLFCPPVMKFASRWVLLHPHWPQMLLGLIKSNGRASVETTYPISGIFLHCVLSSWFQVHKLEAET